MSKRVKINFDTINKDNFENLDISSFYIDREKRIQEEAKAKQKAIELEKERISKIKCPVCQSVNKHHHTKYENNGIMGSGFSSWLVEEYLICKSCGIHYSDINKNK